MERIKQGILHLRNQLFPSSHSYLDLSASECLLNMSRIFQGQPGQTNDLQLAIGNSSEAMDIRVGSTAISFGQTLFSLDIPRPLKVVNIWNNASDSMTLCEVKVLEKCKISISIFIMK